MRLFILALILSCCSIQVWAHEGDEEVSVKHNPRFGGRVSPVIMEEDHDSLGKPTPQHRNDTKVSSGQNVANRKHETHNDPKFMSEILVSDENNIRLYFYNLEMKDIDLKDFPEELIIDVKLPGMASRGPRIALKKTGKSYLGTLPSIKKKPYDFYIDFIVKSEILHITFKAMD